MEKQKKLIANFTIEYTQFLDPKGKPTQPLPDFAEQKDRVIELYQSMVQTRLFDSKAVKLQRMGKMGTFPSVLGQEAIGVGVGSVMRQEDVLCPNYRDYGAQFLHGVTMLELLTFWGGDERGSDFANAREDFPVCIPIASQTLHAVGVATAIKLRKESRVVVALLGDGATSRGDFYEAINLAGVWQLPIVFVINNNQWAISLPRKEQTRAETLAQKGIAAGIPSEQVDGNDVISVYEIVGKAMDRARGGQGPSLIEALSYRMSDHTTADDANRYRDEAELELHRLEDPIARLKNYLLDKKWWDLNKEKILVQDMEEKVNTATSEYLNTRPNTPESIFDHLYETLPASLNDQREEIKSLFGKSNDE